MDGSKTKLKAIDIHVDCLLEPYSHVYLVAMPRSKQQGYTPVGHTNLLSRSTPG